MIDNLETLVQLAQTGTMRETATKLPISQRAVIKRIAAVEKYYDRRLIERLGRRVVLTHHGQQLVNRVLRLIQEVRSVFLEDNALRKGRVIFGISESILSSWGSRLFAKIQHEFPEVEFEFHSQRSPVVLDRLRSGELMVGLCTGYANAETDLVSEIVRQEPMVVIPFGLQEFDFKIGDRLDVITIESRSGAWTSIEDHMKRLNLYRRTSLESFFEVAQMSISGFGHGLIPEGVARALHIQEQNGSISERSG